MNLIYLQNFIKIINFAIVVHQSLATKIFTCEPLESDKQSCIFHGINVSRFQLTFKVENNSSQAPRRHVQFRTSQFSEIPKQLFSSFLEIETLVVKGCGINDITSDNFMNAVQLRVLDLSENKIKRLFKFSFRNAQNLTWLNLSKNLLEFVDQEAFLWLKNLSFLDLSENNLKIIKVDFVTHQSMTMIVQKNIISELVILGRFETPLIIRADHNNISNVSVFGFTVKELYLSYNLMKDTPFLCDHKTFGQLKNLDLSNNRVREVYYSCFKQMMDLQKVDLRHNSLSLMSREQIKHLKNGDQIDSDVIQEQEKSRLLMVLLSDNNSLTGASSSLPLFSLKFVALFQSISYIIARLLFITNNI